MKVNRVEKWNTSGLLVDRVKLRGFPQLGDAKTHLEVDVRCSEKVYEFYMSNRLKDRIRSRGVARAGLVKVEVVEANDSSR
jgi:hypothetical protein